MDHQRAEPSFTTPRATSPRGPTPPPDRTSTLALSVRSLAKSYHAGVVGCGARVDALRGIDLDILAGEAVVIVGPAGSGKSTLLLCLAGLLQADVGSVAWFGSREAGCPPGIGYLPQHPATYPCFSAREAVEFHAMLRGVPAAERADAVREALDRAGVVGDTRGSVGASATDTTVRIALAQALVGRPRALVLDDALTGLDPIARGALSDMLRFLVGEGMTLLAAARVPDALDAVATRVASMARGRMTSIGPTDALRSSRAIELTVTAPTRDWRVVGPRVAETECNDPSVRGRPSR